MAIDFIKIDKHFSSYREYCEKGSWLEYSEEIEEFLYSEKNIFAEEAKILLQIDNLQDTTFGGKNLYELRDVALAMKNKVKEIFPKVDIVLKSCEFLDNLYNLCCESIDERKKIVAVVD